MKFPIIGGAVFLLSGAAALAAVALINPPQDSRPGPTTNASPEQPTAGAPATLVFSVPDMRCEFACAPTVRKTLAAVPGVESVKTDVEKQTATVQVAGAFDEAQAIAALAAEGFTAERAPN